MIILGIDTSAYVNAMGVVDGDRVLADDMYPAQTDSLEQIVDNIDTTLKKAGLPLARIDGFGVGLGPGSWTGIRVGVTVGKILAFSSKKPVCGVPTLEALAYTARGEAPLILPVIAVGVGDAVYAGLYSLGGYGVKRAGDYYTGDIKELSALLTKPAVVVGAEAKRYAELLQPASGITLKTVATLPSGAAVASLAGVRLARGENDDALSLAPLYLKESTARVFVNRNKKE